MKKFILAATLAAASLAVQAKDIVDTAVAAGSFKTLAAALQAAGLVDTLKGKGPFTVFAPTDEAFAKIPKADLDALLKDKAKLTAVLTYHVVPGKVMAKDVKAGSVKTVQGGMLQLATAGGVTVNGAKVVAADVVRQQRRDPRHRPRGAAAVMRRGRSGGPDPAPGRRPRAPGLPG
jgi:uncharacterized surface protein with fasciclin (FAS1) repeats